MGDNVSRKPKRPLSTQWRALARFVLPDDVEQLAVYRYGNDSFAPRVTENTVRLTPATDREHIAIPFSDVGLGARAVCVTTIWPDIEHDVERCTIYLQDQGFGQISPAATDLDGQRIRVSLVPSSGLRQVRAIIVPSQTSEVLLPREIRIDELHEKIASSGQEQPASIEH